MSKKDQVKLSKVRKNKTNKAVKKTSIFTILFAFVLVALCVGTYLGVRHVVINLRYREYTQKMETYGFNKLYTNGKAKATEKVSNKEMFKVILGSILNLSDESQLYFAEEDPKAGQDVWYSYATSLGINTLVSQDELEYNAKRIEAVMLTTKALENKFNIDINKTKLNMKKTKLSEFTADEQDIISKAVTLGIISNKTSAISQKELLKGELNKLVITIVEEYATIYYGSTKLDESGNIVRQDVSIVTDKKKKPNNYEEFPYIVDNIEKEIYEQELKVLTQEFFISPKETYDEIGYLYQQTDEMLTGYFNNILNIDYTTITTKSFVDALNVSVAYYLEEQAVKDYVDYVKKNKIKLEGKATPLLPIMYYNGEQYVVRTKLEFNVVSADTEYNLLFGDENSKIKYASENIIMYVDVPTAMTLNSNSLRMYVSCLATKMSQESTSVVVED